MLQRSAQLWCAINASTFMRRLSPTNTRAAVHPARLCDALGDPAEADVDARSRAGKKAAVAWPLVRQLHQLLPQSAVVFALLVAARRSRNPHQLAGVRLAEAKLLPQPPHFRLAHYEPKWFFRITDSSASLSRLRFATSFFSRVFSSRSVFTSLDH